MEKYLPPPAPKGNSRGTKLKNPDVRQEAYKQFCEHVASGWPIEAFFFDHPTHSVSYKTMLRYIDENPAEFPTIKMEKARAARYKHWLVEGQTLMRGGYEKCAPTIWQTCMRNIFKDVGWDREQITQVSKTYVQQLAENIRDEFVAETKAGDSNIEQTD